MCELLQGWINKVLCPATTASGDNSPCECVCVCVCPGHDFCNGNIPRSNCEFSESVCGQNYVVTTRYCKGNKTSIGWLMVDLITLVLLFRSELRSETEHTDIVLNILQVTKSSFWHTWTVKSLFLCLLEEYFDLSNSKFHFSSLSCNNLSFLFRGTDSFFFVVTSYLKCR